MKGHYIYVSIFYLARKNDNLLLIEEHEKKRVFTIHTRYQ
jgi:hypothetical protein